MQWRWLLPLLLSFPNSPFLPLPDDYSLYTSVPYSQHILHYLSTYHLPPTQSPSYTWPLLFPACRHSSLTKNIFLPFKSLFASLDSIICRSYFNVNINLPTSLCLPASDIIHIRSTLLNIHLKFDVSLPTRNTSTAQSLKPNYSLHTSSQLILKPIPSGTAISITLKSKHTAILLKTSSRHYGPK